MASIAPTQPFVKSFVPDDTDRVAAESRSLVSNAGNFKTLQQAIREYSSDAMRIALADAGGHRPWDDLAR